MESEQLSQKSPAFADAQEVIKPDPLLSDYDEDLDEDESFFEDIIEEEESDEEISDDTLVQDLSETKPIIFNNPAVVEESAHQNTWKKQCTMVFLFLNNLLSYDISYVIQHK